MKRKRPRRSKGSSDAAAARDLDSSNTLPLGKYTAHAKAESGVLSLRIALDVQGLRYDAANPDERKPFDVIFSMRTREIAAAFAQTFQAYVYMLSRGHTREASFFIEGLSNRTLLIKKDADEIIHNLAKGLPPTGSSLVVPSEKPAVEMAFEGDMRLPALPKPQLKVVTD